MPTPPNDLLTRMPQAASDDLGRVLFRPRAVAIVGQSNDPGKTAGRPLKYLRQAGFAGAVYPVNARRDTVLGERAWPSLAALPETPEHAYIVAPTDAAIEAVAQCGERGVKVATVLADGFAEAGERPIARRPIGRELGEGGLCFLVLAFVGERAGCFESRAGFGGLALLPVDVAAPGPDAGEDENQRGNDVVAVLFPQFFQAFASYFLVDFLENVGHERNSGSRGKRPRNPPAGSSAA